MHWIFVFSYSMRSYWSSLMPWEATDQVWCYEKLLIKFDAMRSYWSSLMLWEATDQVWCYEKLLIKFDAMRSYWSSLMLREATDQVWVSFHNNKGLSSDKPAVCIEHAILLWCLIKLHIYDSFYLFNIILKDVTEMLSISNVVDD